MNYSNYSNIWKVILLLIISKSLKEQDWKHYVDKSKSEIKELINTIDEYYDIAFSPEVINAINLIEDKGIVAQLKGNGIKKTKTKETSREQFQFNLMYLENKFTKAFQNLKLKMNFAMFIDGIDIRPNIPYKNYIECIKGLTRATWELNNSLFSNVRDSKGSFRIILLLRPDIFYQSFEYNATQKLQDNSVHIKWKTTDSDYRDSPLFEVAEKVLRYNQEHQAQKNIKDIWDKYFPWETDAFKCMLRTSLSRPRDILQIMICLRDKQKTNDTSFYYETFESDGFQNNYSEYFF